MLSTNRCYEEIKLKKKNGKKGLSKFDGHISANRLEVDAVKFFLTIPPSVNKIWGRGRNGVHRTKEYTEWIRINHENLGCPGYVGGQVSISVKITGGIGWRRGRDIDNIIKPVCDMCTSLGVWDDDRCEIVRCVRISFFDGKTKKSRAKCSVVVKKIGKTTP